MAHATYTFYFKAPGNFTVEVYCEVQEKQKHMYTHILQTTINSI